MILKCLIFIDDEPINPLINAVYVMYKIIIMYMSLYFLIQYAACKLYRNFLFNGYCKLYKIRILYTSLLVHEAHPLTIAQMVQFWVKRT